MLKVTIPFIFSLIVFCNAKNSRAGTYHKLVFTQYHPHSAHLKIHGSWPSEDYKQLDLSSGAQYALENHQDWIIGSLSPHNIKEESPRNCTHEINTREAVEIDEPLYSILNRQWTVFVSASTEENAWKDAWIEYGTCMTRHEETRNPKGYFQTAINFLNGCNVGNRLASIGVKSGDKFRMSELIETLQAAVFKRLELMCITHGKYFKRQYLLGVTLCYGYYRGFVMEMCDFDVFNHCDADTLIYIP